MSLLCLSTSTRSVIREAHIKAYKYSIKVDSLYLFDLYSCNVIRIRFNRLITECLIQQTAQSVMNNHLSLMTLLHVSTSKKPSSGRYIQRRISTENSVKDVRRKSSNIVLSIKVLLIHKHILLCL